MSQTTPNPPTLVMNTAGNRQQVPLRDYLNARVAPFLKKAITESLGVEAEFPLQWLGECLIHQSILYEGNPDKTNIRERFLYDFQMPVAEPVPEPVPAPVAEPVAEPVTEPTEAQPSTTPAQAAEITDSDMAEEIVAPPIVTSTAPSEPVPSAGVVQTSVPNGVPNGEQPEAEVPKDTDTEMGGTS